jgi:hypothetical protein
MFGNCAIKASSCKHASSRGRQACMQPVARKVCRQATASHCEGKGGGRFGWMVGVGARRDAPCRPRRAYLPILTRRFPSPACARTRSSCTSSTTTRSGTS